MQAKFQQLGNDLYWAFRLPTKWNADNTKFELGESLQWTGYNDAHWWNQVATQPGHNTRQTSAGTTYQLDYYTNLVTLVS